MPTDWKHWVPLERAVLCFIVQGGRVLLIHKRRGLGAGKVNAPGGKIEPGEAPEAAAVRETQEEIGVTPLGLEERGMLHFQFVDGYALQCTIFLASGLEGEPIETAEATPFWLDASAVPYEQMWEDDRYWLPQVLAGKSTSAYFDFEGERMLSSRIEFFDRRSVLVAGCGFLGLAAARLFAGRGWAVAGCTHSTASAEALAGEPLRAVSCDLGVREEVERIGGKYDAVIHCASSGRGGPEAYRRVYVEGVRNLAETFAAPVFFTGSTSVYAQTDGGWVTEEDPAEPERETGRALRDAEALALEHGGAVARLAGLYGPARSVLLRKFLAGEAAIEGDGSRWINQIHRDDAAAALWTLVSTRARGVYNVADDCPLAQRELYATLAERFGRPLPPAGPVDPNRKRGWTHKRVSNAKLRARGWQPRYASFYDAVAADPHLTG